jgi:serine/threonine-protein kinase
MADQTFVSQLLEEALQSGRTAEDVCADHPHLLDEVRGQLSRLARVRGKLDALFPEPEPTGPPPPLARPELPRVPGHEVEGMLGRGGMGVVYLARNVRLNRPVAVKMLLAGAYAGPDELVRFRREAEALAELGHPNVVQIYEAGELDGLPYFTMELVEGGTLAEKLAGVPLPAGQAAALVLTLAGAVQAAHDRAIVHRDLKPGNVLLTPDGVPKISDFGVARRLGPDTDITRTGARLGTPSYMAPEQAAGTAGAACPAVDTYALGAVLYELLTGRPPFRAETVSETERQVIEEEPAPPSHLNARVPRDLETVCLKCLAKDPRRRYARAADLAADLGRYLRGEPVAARPVGTLERAGRLVRRHPGRAAAGLAGVLVAAALLLGGWWALAERAATERAVEGDLAEAEQALERSSWAEARTALDRARLRLGGGGPAGLRGRLDRADGGLELASRLEDVRTKYVESAGTGPGGMFDWAQADRDYETVFREAALGTPDDPPEQVAERVRATGVRRAVVAALDRWAACAPDRRRLGWVFAVARAADPDPGSGWRDRVRDAGVGRDAAVLAELARTAPLDGQSVPLHLTLGHWLGDAGGDGVGFLRRVQEAHPDDFWATFQLAVALDLRRDPDAIGYYRAALSIRPRSLAALNNLGVALEQQGRLPEAAEHQEAVVRLFPDSFQAHYNLARAYHRQDRLGPAADQCRQAIRLNPDDGANRAELGWILFDQGELDEARARSRRALELLPGGEDLPSRELVKERPKIRSLAEWTIARCDRLLALEGRLDGIARGTDVPGGADEAIAFAELCARRRRPAAAARLYAAALAAHPRLSDAEQHFHRPRAARAAVRAGLGDGEDAPPDGPTRAALRGQALGWLLADRDAWAVLYANGDAEGRREAVRGLRGWQDDGALAGVRDPAALARLDGEERRRWRALWASLERLAAGGSLPPLSSAQAYAARREWQAAAEGYARFAETSPADLGQAWFEYAAVQLLAGDRDGYRKTCARLAERYPGTTKIRSYHVARACTLAPDAVEDLGVVTRLSADELKQSGAEFWSLTQQAALLHRAGRSAEAVPLLEQSLKANDRPGVAVLNWLWLALACQKLGRPDEARGWLDRAGAWLDKQGDELPDGARVPGLDLHNWLEAQVLRKEAEKLLR